MTALGGWLWTAVPPLVLGAGLLRVLRLDRRDGGVAWLAWLWAAAAVGHGLLLLGWTLLDLPLAPGLLAGAAVGIGIALGCVRHARRGRAVAARARSGESAGSARRRGRETAAVAASRVCGDREDGAASGGVAVQYVDAAAVDAGGSTRRGLAWLAVPLGVLLALYAVRFVASAGQPVTVGDEAAIWAAKAKALYVAGGDSARLAAELAPPFQPFVQHADYPMLNPLLQLHVFVQSGRITHFANRLPIQLGAIALLLALAGALARRVPAPLAAILLLAAGASAPALELAGFAMSDLIVALGALLLADGWLRARVDGDAAGMPLASLGAAVLVFAKAEGCWILLAFLLLALAECRGRLRAGPLLRAAPLPLAVLVLGFAFNLRFGLGSDLAEPGALARFVELLPERAAAVARHFTVEILLWPPHSCGLLLLSLLLAVAALRGSAAPQRTLLLLPVLVLLGYALVFVTTPHDLGWHLTTAANRIAYHVVPLAALACAAWCQTPVRPIQHDQCQGSAAVGA